MQAISLSTVSLETIDNLTYSACSLRSFSLICSTEWHKRHSQVSEECQSLSNCYVVNKQSNTICKALRTKGPAMLNDHAAFYVYSLAQNLLDKDFTSEN